MAKEAKIVSVVSLFPAPQYVVVLEDSAKTRLVPIWIGMHEGNAIALELQGERFPRPLTHDLMVNILQALKATIEKVVITDLKDSSYFALIHIKMGAKCYTIDARPSDSLALAVRVKCPIWIEEKVLAKCPVIEKPITKEEIDKFKTQLKSMSPEEFFKNLEEAPPMADPPIGNMPQQEDFNDDEEDEEGDEDEK